ncbi:MAG: hypothetical protein ABSG43_08285 [Solirubrobacteraceae bacterium]|jgi:hypothetical protein
MIQIAISGELAAAHEAFMRGCDERGHRVEVLGEERHGSPSPSPAADDGRELPDEAYIGRPHPEKGYYAACSEPFSTDPDDFCGCPICQAAQWSVAQQFPPAEDCLDE